MSRPTALVVGAGITGLSAAHALARTHDVTVLEVTDRVGGKLRTERVAGVPLDVGAEAMLNRRPEGVDLARELGAEVVHPSPAGSRILSRGALRPLPRSLMGIPLDLGQLEESGVLSAAGVRRVREEPHLPPAPPLEGDRSVGDLVAERLGEEVVDRLVEPLLGGVYAGHARLLSARAAVPRLVELLQRGSLLEQAAVPATYSAEQAPVFATVKGGMGRLPEMLRAAGSFRTRTAVTVREVQRTRSGFRVVAGPAPHPEVLEADVVVLAVPAAPAARLLAGVAAGAADRLAGFEAASVAVVTLAVRAADVPAGLHGLSGFLVPPVEHRRIKASTFSFAKWPWVREAGRGAGPGGEDLLFLRASLGRHREEASLQHPDEELVRVSREELAAIIGLDAEPVASHVQRWGGGLPQYPVGHLDRVASLRAEVGRVPGLALCGAAYDGVGVPACIASAQRAVHKVLAETPAR